ncbi:MAG: hypothetical protein CMF59_19460 [Leptospiraceae bacterium]|nr:hypothetical protein [Leptospiraceae bacterium]
MKKRLGILIALASVFLAGCPENTTVPEDEAWSQIYAAIDYKYRECGNQPNYILIVPREPSQYGVELCALTILRQECPFNDYPIFCVEMYDIDLPGIGP